jgi:hypothetical protein
MGKFINLLKNIVQIISCFIGTIAFLWLIIQISEWLKFDWFLPSILHKYGFLGWIIISFPISIIAFFILINLLHSEKQESLIKIDSIHINVKDYNFTMSEHLPIKIEKDDFYNIIKIHAGDYRDFIDDYKKIRIEVKDIITDNFEGFLGKNEKYGVIIHIDTGGGLVFGGEYSKRIGTNEYAIPQKATSDEEPYSIYRFYTTESYFNFLRVFVEHINPKSQEVTLNVFISTHRF